MNKLIPVLAFVGGCAHAQPETDLPPLDEESRTHIESRLAEPAVLDTEVNAETAVIAREVAQCVFRNGKAGEDAGNYKATLFVHRPDKDDVIATALVRSNGDMSLGLDRHAYMGDDHSWTQTVDHGIDGGVDWYEFKNLCRLCPGPRHLEFKKEQVIQKLRPQDTYEKVLRKYDAQDAYEKILRMVAKRCNQMGRGGIRGK